MLGYPEAKNGEPFLKIGVGALVKGSCPSCDSAGDYMFNSPYLFHEEPEWRMDREGDTTLRLEQKIYLNNHGYKLVKEISLVANVLSVTSTLTNLGTEAFSTVWYSHNFFTCDGIAVGPGYVLNLDLKGEPSPAYQEPDTWTWSTPLSDYAVVQSFDDSVRVDVGRALGPGVSIKSLFNNDGATSGGFQIRGCGSSVDTTIPQLKEGLDGITMYAFNLYMERGTLSPEPQILLSLEAGASTTWTQRLVITDADDSDPVTLMTVSSRMRLSALAQRVRSNITLEGLAVFACLLTVGLMIAIFRPQSWRRRSRRRLYNTIRDTDDSVDIDNCSKSS